MSRNLRAFSGFCLLALCIWLLGCSSSGPQQVQPGSPEYFWLGAKRAYDNGEYLDASEKLAKITSSDNSFRVRAEVGLMVLSSGLAQGYMEMADAYELGARTSPENRAAFHGQVSAMRNQAKANLMQFVECVHYFTEHKSDQPVPFEFGPPAGSAAESAAVVKIGKGAALSPAEADSALKGLLQKGVLQAVSKAIGASDPAKSADMLKQQPLQLQRGVIFEAQAAALHEQSQLFGPRKLDEPVKLKTLCGEALEILSQIPDSKTNKDLQAKIQKTMKGPKPVS